jgi:hypothetical protein
MPMIARKNAKYPAYSLARVLPILNFHNNFSALEIPLEEGQTAQPIKSKRRREDNQESFGNRVGRAN